MLSGRKQLRDTLRETAEKAGTLVTAALAIACVALLVAVAALVIGLKVRHAS